MKTLILLVVATFLFLLIPTPTPTTPTTQQYCPDGQCIPYTPPTYNQPIPINNQFNNIFRITSQNSDNTQNVGTCFIATYNNSPPICVTAYHVTNTRPATINSNPPIPISEVLVSSREHDILIYSIPSSPTKTPIPIRRLKLLPRTRFTIFTPLRNMTASISNITESNCWFDDNTAISGMSGGPAIYITPNNESIPLGICSTTHTFSHINYVCDLLDKILIPSPQPTPTPTPQPQSPQPTPPLYSTPFPAVTILKSADGKSSTEVEVGRFDPTTNKLYLSPIQISCYDKEGKFIGVGVAALGAPGIHLRLEW